jgi:YHS domain-containing protein
MEVFAMLRAFAPARPLLAALALAVLAALAGIGGAQAFFGSDEKPAYFAEDGVAIRGYDPVAYFDQGKPVEGSAEHSLEWRGVTWHFASADHRQAFQENPGKYAPAYGGYCAYAVAKDQLASVDPTAWKIVDGQLYLNYSHDIQKTWEEDIDGYIAQAETNWPDLDPGRE